MTDRASVKIEIRPRTNDDLPLCATILRAVHDTDGYPARWPENPAAWLTPAGLVAAWVAVTAQAAVGPAGPVTVTAPAGAGPVDHTVGSVAETAQAAAGPADQVAGPTDQAAGPADHAVGPAGKILGHVALITSDRSELELVRLFVAPEARGSGAARALVAAVTRRAAEEKTPLVLEVVDNALAAIACYESLGWNLTDWRPAEWLTPDGARPVLRHYRAPDAP